MLSLFSKLIKENAILIFVLLSILLVSTVAEASKTALIYHSNYSDAHTNVKTQLEADGYTVTLSTTGTVGLSGNTDGCAYNCTNNNNSNTITTTNTDITDSDYGNDVAVYPYRTYLTGDGK